MIDILAAPVSIVFVAGSRQISRLPAEVKARLDTMIEKHFQILVGDANGADKAVQRYLADKSYPNVLVHSTAPRASITTPSRTARWLRRRSIDSCSGTARARALSSTLSTCHAITSRSSCRRADKAIRTVKSLDDFSRRLSAGVLAWGDFNARCELRLASLE
jgi:hypothetical protein